MVHECTGTRLMNSSLCAIIFFVPHPLPHSGIPTVGTRFADDGFRVGKYFLCDGLKLGCNMFSGGLTVGQCSGGDGLNIARMGGVLPKN